MWPRQCRSMQIPELFFTHNRVFTLKNNRFQSKARIFIFVNFLAYGTDPGQQNQRGSMLIVIQSITMAKIYCNGIIVVCNKAHRIADFCKI
jgi:hypothetical protein